MFAKLLTIILAFGIVACVLLVNRQQRIETAHEMSEIHQRLAEHDRTVWQLRAEIARRCSPRELHQATGQLAERFVPFTEQDILHAPDERRFANRPAPSDTRRPREDWGG